MRCKKLEKHKPLQFQFSTNIYSLTGQHSFYRRDANSRQEKQSAASPRVHIFLSLSTRPNQGNKLPIERTDPPVKSPPNRHLPANILLNQTVPHKNEDNTKIG